LPVRLERHEAARLLPARVNQVTLTSVVSDDGVILTHAHVELIPGDKRLLHLELPAQARFWFAFVNQNGVWPWRETNQILIPLEQHSKVGATTTVEFFYASPTAKAGRRSLDLDLDGPKFDLPLENITWHIHLNGRWQVRDWAGSLQLKEQHLLAAADAADLDGYLQTENTLNRKKIQDAEQLLTMANSLLAQGEPQQARRAFQAAYGLSQHDQAFNEDARVQLHNLKMQQALVGLNARQAVIAGDTATPAARLGETRAGRSPAYTQDEAKQILDRNTAEENAIQLRLAERLVQQQEAVLANPAAIRAAVPAQGRRLTFTRALQIEPRAELAVTIEARALPAVSGALQALALAGILVLLGGLAWAARPAHGGVER
jgi:hypothetical protein